MSILLYIWLAGDAMTILSVIIAIVAGQIPEGYEDETGKFHNL